MKRLTCIAALGLATLASTASAQDLEFWGESDYWQVMIDPSLGYGCLIQTAYEDGTFVRIGFDLNEGEGYVAAFNDTWGDIAQDEWYPVLFALDRNEYDGEARGVWWDGTPGLDIPFDSTDFLFDIAKKYTMSIYNEYGDFVSFDLTGSYRALEAAVECQDEVGW